jgi:hypothetical protein
MKNLQGGGAFTEDFETGKRRHWKRNVSVYGSSVRETKREVSFSEDTESYVKVGTRDGASVSMWRLRKENLEGGSSTGTPRDMSRKAL